MSEAESDKSKTESDQETTDEQLIGYTFVKTLGKGNFGKVKLGIHSITNEYVAIKILEKDLIFEKADIERISRQIKIMKLVRHPNIIQLYEIIETQKRLYLIMEFAEEGDLFDIIVSNKRLKEDEATTLFSKIILGLEYLHSKKITHRDLKPQNILLSLNDIKIADFGLGNFFLQGENLKTACGSPCYASPEMLQKNPYNPQKVDIWSIGIILYAMVCGYLPFEDESTNKLYEKIKNNPAKYPHHLSENIKNVLRKLLQKSPEKRITISELKEEPWLRPYFENSQLREFEVEEEKVKKICQIYGLEEQEKLISYLKKNKHNNLTTLYYIAAKKQFKNKSQKEVPEMMEKTQKQNEISFKNLVGSSDESEKESLENQLPNEEINEFIQSVQEVEIIEKPQPVQTKQPQEVKNKKQIKINKRKQQQLKQLVKNSRMPIQKPQKLQNKSVILYERSSSKDRPLKVKKIIGKVILQEPYLINPNYLVGSTWQNFCSYLVQCGGEGRIEYYKYGKGYIYISRSALKGVGNLCHMIDKFNESI